MTSREASAAPVAAIDRLAQGANGVYYAALETCLPGPVWIEFIQRQDDKGFG